MEAPAMGPAKVAASATYPPIAIAAACPTARTSVATAEITNIKNRVRMISNPSAWKADPDGTVAPRCATLPKRARCTALAAQAPISWART